MLQRPATTPGLTAGELVNQDVVVTHLREWVGDTTRTREQIQAWRQQIEDVSRQLENPKAAVEYLDFFDGFFSRAVDELTAIIDALAGGFVPAHADTLRQLASNAAVEVRRTVLFRDKWVNKPLPYETVRPVLSQMAGDVRDQLNDYREMTIAANVLIELNTAPPASAPTETRTEGLGRRELFSRLVRPLGDAVAPKS